VDVLLRVGLTNAALAALLALPTAVAARYCRRPALVHGLWLLVLLKLVTPPLVGVPISWPAIGSASSTSAAGTPLDALAAVGADSIEPQIASLLASGVALGPQEFVAPGDPDSRANGAASARRFGVNQRVDTAPLAVVVLVWLLGSAIWWLLACWRVGRFHRLLRHARPAPAGLQRQADDLAAALGLRGGPPVYLVPGRLAPLLWAVGRPRLVLPADLPRRLDRRQLDAILAHELAHLRRRDHWVRALELVALGLYWWLPVTWYVCRRLREAEEQCCDAWVVATLPGSGRAYATALVDTLDFLAGAPAAPAAACGLGTMSDLKRRLGMIMAGKTARALSWSGCAAVLGLGALLLPLAPAWVTGQEEKRGAEKRPEPPKREDLEKARAEIQQLRAELDKKAAELAALARKIHEAHGRLGPADGRAGPAGRPGGEPRVLILRMVDDGKWVVMPAPFGEAGRPGGLGGPFRRPPEGGPGGRGPGDRPPPPPEGRAERRPEGGEARGPERIERLERQLDALLRELETMRREIGKQRGPDGEGPRRPNSPPPPRERE
jgi:beta-lactamase regulating signal transducer with metallopeptidase domain